MDETVSIENPEDEVLLGESVSEDARRIRVYGVGGDDFIVEIPAGAKVTFGYFNPSNGGMMQPHQGYRETNVAKQTALRIYERGEKSNQLACFIGVLGFRDLQIKKTKLSQKVVVERRYSDDGEGNEDWGGQVQRQLVVKAEDESIPF